MTNKEKRIAWEIIECGLQNAPNPGCVCHSLYDSQQVASIQDFQIPEPWNGDIVNAPILFLGINPGFTSDELYPKTGDPYWRQTPGVLDATKVEDFFEQRFSQRPRNFINTPYVLIDKNNTFRSLRCVPNLRYTTSNRYWKFIYEIANYEIYNKYGRNAIPGEDYCITEVARCKSKNIQGVNINKCAGRCADKFLFRTLDLATNIKLLVVVGSTAKKIVSNLLKGQFGCIPNWYSSTIVTLPNLQNVKVVFIPHQNARGLLKPSLAKYKAYFPKGLL